VSGGAGGSALSNPDAPFGIKATSLKPRSQTVTEMVKLASQPHPRRFASVDLLPVGTWLSLVEHSLGVRGVGSSNLPVPTNNFMSSFQGLAATPIHAFEPRYSVNECYRLSTTLMVARPVAADGKSWRPR
jgi:hypothetical protein